MGCLEVDREGGRGGERERGERRDLAMFRGILVYPAGLQCWKRLVFQETQVYLEQCHQEDWSFTSTRGTFKLKGVAIQHAPDPNRKTNVRKVKGWYISLKPAWQKCLLETHLKHVLSLPVTCEPPCCEARPVSNTFPPINNVFPDMFFWGGYFLNRKFFRAASCKHVKIECVNWLPSRENFQGRNLKFDSALPRQTSITHQAVL